MNCMSLFTKIFGESEKKVAGKYQPIVEKINQLEPKFEAFSLEELKAKTQEFKERLSPPSAPGGGGEETLDDLLPEAFAAVREAAKRTIGQRHFDAQLIGGMVLHEGKIAEMKTGEGKTLAATLAVYLNALQGLGVHVVTVNDYLSKRDANWMGAIYQALGMSVGCIQHEISYVYETKVIDKNEVTVEMENLKQVARPQAYAADVTYGTNNEFGFDYLRDNMVNDLSQMAQRPASTRGDSSTRGGEHQFAIVDEVDSILIDEARTPLIISAPDMESNKLYETFSRIAPQLKENDPSTHSTRFDESKTRRAGSGQAGSGQGDYNIDEKMRTSTLTEAGIEKVEKILGLGNIYTEGGIKYVHHLEQALRAQTLFKRDRNYVVKDGEIIIVDEFTGRLMHGRRYSEGLHQALEAKEGVEVQKESRTLATITFQNYFRMYKKLAGMTGTAYTSAEEFSKVYKLEVVQIPTNKPMVRVDATDSVYRTEKGKFQAVIREINERHKKGQPVLVGTVSIEKNEILGQLLQREGIPHEILNAKNHEREAQIIAKAGEPGAVTIATNMAGRGVDIILGGRIADNENKSEWQARHDQVIKAGGLHILGTERHEARRIDDQLRGRSGRQGDPGSSQFFVSLEDDLMRIFAPDRIKRMMEILKVPEDQPIENKMIGRAIESAQGKIEGFNFDTRKHVLEYDDVMNKQRETIYRKRLEILESPTLNTLSEQIVSGSGQEKSDKDILMQEEGKGVRAGLKEKVLELIVQEISKIVGFHTQESYKDNWNYEEIFENLNAIFLLPSEARQQMKDAKDKDELIEYLIGLAKKAYEEKEKQVGAEQMRQIEKFVYLHTIDTFWMDHLDEMEHLRDSVRLRAYGQKDPLVEYKNEGHQLFQRLLGAIQTSFVGTIYKVTLAPSAPNYPVHNVEFRGGNMPTGVRSPQNNQSSRNISQGKQPLKIGRNDLCPCGSGKKFKKCGMLNTPEHQQNMLKHSGAKHQQRIGG